MQLNKNIDKNLLLLIPNVGFGGAERVFHDHSVALSKKFNVIECVFNAEGQRAYQSGNKFISLDVPAGSSVLRKIYYFWLRSYRLKKLKKKYKVDICVSHLEGADYINLLSKGKEKVVLCIHGSKLHDQNIAGAIGWIRKKILMPGLYNRADHIITVSRDINPELIFHFGIKPQRIRTINNFFDFEKISTKAVEPIESIYESLFQEHEVIITSGRLAVQKNQLPLLKVFSEVKKLRPLTRLVFIGDGELRELLVREAKKLNLNIYQAWQQDAFSTNYDVYFLGYQANPFKFIKRAKVFVLPSAWEGFPMALGEAMICGLPVIAADCPTGPREMLSPDITNPGHLAKEEMAKYGILMPLLDQKSNEFAQLKTIWVNTLINILNQPNKQNYYAEQAQIRMQDFTESKIVAQWEKVLLA